MDERVMAFFVSDTGTVVRISPVSVSVRYAQTCDAGADRAVCGRSIFVSALHGVADDWGVSLTRVMLVWSVLRTAYATHPNCVFL